MSLIVLKFGGSVLEDEDTLCRAVHEIYRWRREGRRVVAVVSALAGRTARLQQHADAHGVEPDSAARAAVLTSGERESAALLALKLERAGIAGRMLTPDAVEFCAHGPAHDAHPVAINTDRLRRALARDGVVIFPGYTATGEFGEPVALGRGGSDLTAVFLAHALDAERCRLIKDVDGLYDCDPRSPGALPQRYARATWENALATDGSIIQHKAVRWARNHAWSFELGALNSNRPTLIGEGPTRLSARGESRTALRVGLLGHGTVGAGVAELIAASPDKFELAGVAVRNPIAHPGLDPAAAFTDPLTVARLDIDVLVEAIGGEEAPEAAIRLAQARGIPVVSANKAFIAATGDETIRCSAAVGGATPVLETVQRGNVESVRGILCGTANFVLDRMRQGSGLECALEEARRRGLAEADPSRDLDGRDAADKLCVIARQLGVPIEPAAIDRETIHPDTDPELRQVAHLEFSDGQCRASVGLEHLSRHSPLRRATGAQTAVLVERVGGTSEFLLGAGAGRWPTAEAVFADLLQLSRDEEAAHVA